jgi:hypothetical protein
VDARRPAFLEDLIDEGEHRFSVASLGLLRAEGITHGVLRGPCLPCRYTTKIECGHDFVTHRHARYRVELDLHVPELAALDIRLEHFDRDARKVQALADLWIDDVIIDAWNEHVVEGDRLAIKDGQCVFVGHVAAADRTRMRGLVDVMAALASIPARRAVELRAALVRFDIRSSPARIALDADPIVLQDNVQIGLRGGDLRMYIETENAGVQFARWANAPGWAHDAIAALQPSSIYAIDRVVIELGGWVVDPARLGAAITLVRNLAKHTDMPYR